MVEDKFSKTLDSLTRAIHNYNNGDKRLAIGDINFLIDNAIKTKYFILAEIEEDSEQNNHKGE